MPGGMFLMIPFGDVLLHGWDIAKATGQDTRLDPNLVEICYQAFAPQIEGIRAIGGLVGPEVKVPDSGSTQDKLLGIFGRQP